MRSSWGRRLVLWTVLLLPTMGFAQAPEPIATLQLKSVQGMIADFKYFLKLAGKDGEADNLDNVTTLLGGSGLDLKKPLGGYLLKADQPDDSPVVLVLPLDDSNAFFNFLGTLQQRPAKGADGAYSLGSLNLPIPFDFFFRIAHEHVYLTIKQRENLALKKLLPPASLFTAKDANLAVHLDLAGAPANLRQFVLDHFNAGLERERTKDMPGEAEIARKLRLAVLDTIARGARALAADAASLTVEVGVQSKSEDLSLTTRLVAKPGSNLASLWKGLGQQVSPFVALAEKAPASLVAHVSLPEELHAILMEGLQHASTQALRDKKTDFERQMVRQVFEALKPTAQSGKLHVGLMTRGPNNQGLFSVVAGAEIREGEKLDAVYRQLEKFVPDAAREAVKLETRTVDGATVRRAVVPIRQAKQAELLGDTTNVHVALQKNFLWLTAEPDGMSDLQSALAAKESTGPMLSARISMAHAARFMNERERRVAHQIWEGDPRGSDQATFTIEGGDALRISLRVKAKILTFLAETGK